MASLDLKVLVDVQGAEKLQRLGGSLATGAVNVAKYAAAGTAALAGFGVFAGNFASDLNESMSKVDVVFGDNADEIKEWAKTSSKAFGQSQQQALEAAGTYGNLFQAFGIARDDATDMSTSLVELAADLASFNNTSVDEALIALRSGLSGETEPLKRFGIAINDARMRTELLNQGFTDLPATLTPAMKAQAAYALIMQDSTLAQGDFARTSDGMANQQRILAATFQDTMAELGQAFIPIIQELLPHLTTALAGFGDWVTANMPAIKEVIGTVFGAIGAAISFLFTEIVPRLGEAFAWLSTNVFPILSQGVSGASDVIGFLSRDVIPKLVAVFEGVLTWVTKNWPTISSVIGQAFGAIANVVKTTWPIVEAVASVLFPLIASAAEVLLGVLDTTFKLIGGIFETLAGVVKTVVNVIEGAMQGMGQVVSSVWDGITGAIKGAINFIIGIVNGFIGAINSIQIHIPGIETPFGTVARFDWNGLNLGYIPYLAEGGIIDGPTLAMIGERGPEAVIPLNQAGTAALGEVHYHVHLTVEGNLVAESPEEVVDVLRRETPFLDGWAEHGLASSVG